MSQAVEVGRRPGTVPAGGGAALAGGFAFTAYSNLGLQLVLAMVPAAVLHGTRVRPLEFTYALSLHVAAALLATSAAPLVLGRLRPGRVLALSSLLRATGYAVLILTVADAALYAFAVLVGLGLGVARPAVRVLLNGAATPANRARVFQWFFIVLNGALVLAPVFADVGRTRAVLTLTVVTVVELVGGAFVLGAAGTLTVPRSARTGPAWRSGLSLLRRPHVVATVGYTFVCYFAMGFIVAMFLLYDSVTPELAEYRTLFLSFEPLVLIAIQLALIPLFNRFGRRTSYVVAALAGGPGMMLAFTPYLVPVLSGLVLFAFAESLAMPRIQLEAAEAAPPGRQAAMFSVVTVATAVGEIVGNLAAGLVVRQSAGWAVGAGTCGVVVGALTALGMFGGGLALLRSAVANPKEA